MPPLSGGRRFPLHGAPSLATREGEDTLAAGRRGRRRALARCPSLLGHASFVPSALETMMSTRSASSSDALVAATSARRPLPLGTVLIATLALAACSLVFVAKGYQLFQATMVLAYAVALVGLNILTGYSGQISLAMAPSSP